MSERNGTLEESEHGDTVARAYRIIRRRIVRGELPPGSPLAEADLGVAMQMSRTPVRAALQRLVAEGLAERSGKRGTVVTSNASSSIADLFRIRKGLEKQLSQLAVERLTAEEIDALAQEGDESAFHLLLADLVDRPRIRSMIVDLEELIEADGEPAPESVRARYQAQHAEFIEALRARDVEWSVSAMTSHLHSLAQPAEDPVGADQTRA